MDNIPSFRKQDAKFRSVISSKDHNIAQDNMLYDILNLFNRANTLSKDLTDTKDIVYTENVYMQKKILDLESKLAKLGQLYKDITEPDNAFMNINVYPSNMYIDNKNSIPAQIDTSTMDVTLPYASKTSKVHLYDDVAKHVFIPETLNVETRVVSPLSTIKVIENDKLNAFNGNNSSYWRMSIETDNTVNEVIVEMVIGLPEDIISNREINAIICSLYPYGSIDIMNIEYRLFGNWTQIPSFSQHSLGILETYTDLFGEVTNNSVIENSGNTKFCFNDISASEIKITLRQRNYIDAASNRVFYIGAREIEIVNYKYNSDIASIYTKVEFPNDNAKLICDVISALNNQGEVGNNTIQYELFYLDDYDRASKITKGFPFEVDNNKILIKTDIYKNNTSPSLSRLQVIYKDKI